MSGNNKTTINSEGSGVVNWSLLNIQKSDRWRKILRILIGVKLLFLPLIFDVNVVASFDAPKAALSHSLAWVMAAVIIVILLREPWQFRLKWIHLLVLGFVISGLISTFFAVDRVIALFGYPLRLLGFTTILDLGILYAAIVIAVKKPRDFRPILWSLMGGAFISSLYAVLQTLKLDFFVWGSELGARVFSTFGNPDFYGQYLAALTIALMGIIVFQPLRRRFKVLLVFLLIGALVLVGVVGTRSSLIGIAAGAMVIMALWIKRTGIRRKTVIRLSLLFLGGGAIAAIILSQTYIGGRLSWYWIHRGFVQRGVIYETALKAFADHPLFGIGPDNIGVVYFRYRPLRELNLRGPFYTDTSAHGWPIQILTTQGIFGFTIFLVILFAAARIAWKLAPGAYGPFTSMVAAALAAHFGAGLLTPGSISTEWIGWAGIGLLAAAEGLVRNKKSPEVRPFFSSAAAKWASAPLFIAALFGVFWSVRPWIASSYAAIPMLTLRDDSNARDRYLALSAAIKATELDPIRADLWKLRGNVEERAGDLRAAATSYQEATRRSPDYPEHWWNLARINMRLMEGGDPTKKEAALRAMEQAQLSDPNGPETYASSARLLILLGENQRALEAAQKGIELFHTKSDYYILAATAAHRLGRPEEAENTLKEGIKIFSDGGNELMDPLNLALAQLYLELGQIKKSEEQVSLVLERHPDNGEAVAFMEKLKNLKK